jgi:hypothetical protein
MKRYNFAGCIAAETVSVKRKIRETPIKEIMRNKFDIELVRSATFWKVVKVVPSTYFAYTDIF